MKNILIIYANPCRDSFTYQVLKTFVSDLSEQNHSVVISDLYQMSFKSDLGINEYEREGKSRLDLSIPKDVLREQKKIQVADCITFIYPLWWSDCPAKLKGWFDRVFTKGFAYGYDLGRPIIEMKKIKKGLVICTAGHTVKELENMRIAQSMKTIMLNDRLGERFIKKEMVILGGMLHPEKWKAINLETIHRVDILK